MTLLNIESRVRIVAVLASATVFIALALLLNQIFVVGAFLCLAAGSIKGRRAKNGFLMLCVLVAVLVLAYQLGKWLAVSERRPSGLVTCEG